ncbi:MAG: phosphatidylglycerophosphatase A [Candidatus Syntrophosphaera sp.]|nr:phosphatidylglycerophosphatase A [Candidatus Syntrophosphaera sp.]
MPEKKMTPATFLASVFGVGFIPFAPGTFGTLVAVGIYLLLPEAVVGMAGWHFFLPGLILLTAISIWLSGLAEPKLGHDAPQIVIDEVCGYFLAVFMLPRSLLLAVYAFVLFRAFDIAKPFPVNISQRLPKGWGVVVDDLVAGLYANLLLQILIRIVPKFFGL